MLLSLNEQITFEDDCCCDEIFVNDELNEEEMNQICDLNSKYEIRSSSSTNTISTSIKSNPIIIEDVFGLF
jgi:hypothetical protein